MVDLVLKKKQLISVKQFGKDLLLSLCLTSFFGKTGMECIFDLEMDTRVCTVRIRGWDASEMKVIRDESRRSSR